MGLLDAVSPSNATDWAGVVLAFLNVLQTVALAYLAADRHAVRSARNAGQLTRSTDPPASPSSG